MPISILNSTITGLAAGGLPSGSVTSASLASTARQYKFAYSASTDNLSLGGDSGWQTFKSVTFTVTEANSTAIVYWIGAHGYESGAVNCTMYFGLSGATSATSLEFQTLTQGVAVNFGYGAHNCQYMFYGLNAGSHTITLYARNWTGGTTGIFNYFDNPAGSRQSNDWLMVAYM
jgi:hypothetical protein